MSRKPHRNIGRSILVTLATLLLLTSIGWFSSSVFGPPDAAPIAMPQDPTFSYNKGKVMLNVPDRAMADDTDVAFSYGTKATQKATVNAINTDELPFKAISTPVDIKLTKGWLMSDKVAVTLKYDPKLIPKGLTADQVGMVVYDETLLTWVPIMNARADAKTNTVTGIAPHFSWFSAFVLDPAQKVVTFAGQQIKTVIDATVTVTSWLTGMVKELTTQLVKDLFGQMEPLNCKPESKRIEVVATTSQLDLLKSCVETGGDNDRLRLGNGYAFPLLTEELPLGTTLEVNDVWNNGGDLTDLVRSTYWANQNRAYVTGAGHASITVTPLTPTVTIKMDVDAEAIAFDIGLAVLSVFAPPTKVATSATKGALTAMLKGEDFANRTGEGVAWFNSVYSMLDCIIGASHGSIEARVGMEPVDEMFTKEGYEDAAGLAHDCLGSALEGLNLKGALAEMLSVIKVIPEVLTSATYVTAGALLEGLPSQFDAIKQQQPSVTVARIEAEKSTEAAPRPTKKADKPKAPVTARDAIAPYTGTWYNAAGKVTIKSDWSGQYTWKARCEAAEDGKIHPCSGKAPLMFALDKDGSLVATWWGNPVITYQDPSLSAPHDLLTMKSGQSFKLYFPNGKGRVLHTTPGEGQPTMGSPHLCDRNISASSPNC